MAGDAVPRPAHSNLTQSLTRHGEVLYELEQCVLARPGAVDPELRQSLARGDQPPAALSDFVEKVRRHAYKVVDGDLEALRDAGFTDDELFEITVATAVGDGLRRLDSGLRALRLEAEP